MQGSREGIGKPFVDATESIGLDLLVVVVMACCCEKSSMHAGERS
jgi:hypothetical protein